MGVGLSISRTIIETHGGRMWAETNSSGGATFRFTLPAASAKDIGHDAER
jgi:two-component system sensor kinase FixL